ncbi:hypothetical protein ACH40E_33390 [Streptomyces acidicola]|uniref:hypothetical protein n=1 Tax=Streptomyces acidicola TaxID=2596892 RepID=UPI0037B30011
MSQTSPDARAVVRALDALTTQAGRIADALTTPVTEDVRAVDDDATTPATTCPTPLTHNWGCGCPTDQYAAAGCGHRGLHPGFTCDQVDQTRPYWDVRWGQVQQALAADEADTFRHARAWAERHGLAKTSEDSAPAPAAVEEAQRIARRRDSLLNLLDRLDRHGTLTHEERALLRRQVQDEGIGHDTARSVAAGNKRHVQVMYADLQQAQAAAEEQSERARIFETELRVLRTGLRAAGGDPTQIQNLWAQIRLRNRQWREAKREAALTRSMLEAEGGDVALVDEMLATVSKAEGEAREAQAAIERVRALLDTHLGPLATAAVRRALDGTEQPSTTD